MPPICPQIDTLFTSSLGSLNGPSMQPLLCLWGVVGAFSLLFPWSATIPNLVFVAPGPSLISPKTRDGQRRRKYLLTYTEKVKMTKGPGTRSNAEPRWAEGWNARSRNEITAMQPGAIMLLSSTKRRIFCSVKFPCSTALFCGVTRNAPYARSAAPPLPLQYHYSLPSCH